MKLENSLVKLRSSQLLTAFLQQMFCQRIVMIKYLNIMKDYFKMTMINRLVKEWSMC